MKVLCEIDYVNLPNSDGEQVRSVCLTCSRCGHETESFGTGERSIKRCLVLMREECPENEDNFYVSEEDE